MNYYLAIDQGGTKTDALLLTREGKILARVDDRDIRQHGENFNNMQGRFIRHVAEKAFAIVGESLDHLDGVCAAVCGANWDEDYVYLHNLVVTTLAIPPELAVIVNDCIAALRGGLPFHSGRQNCAILCAGTRMNCALRSAEGNKYVYGFFIGGGDQGAFTLGHQAWFAVIDSHNGFDRPTMLEDIFLKYHNASSVTALYADFTTERCPFTAPAYAPFLFDAAYADDVVAGRIIRRYARRWARFVTLGLPKIGLAADAPFTLVLSGGLFKGNGDILSNAIIAAVTKDCPNVVCLSATLEPVAGSALLLFEKLHGHPLPVEVIEVFSSTLHTHALYRH